MVMNLWGRVKTRYTGEQKTEWMFIPPNNGPIVISWGVLKFLNPKFAMNYHHFPYSNDVLQGISLNGWRQTQMSDMSYV